jgi:hypothetical protein
MQKKNKATPKTMDEWRVDFKQLKLAEKYQKYGLGECMAELRDWIAGNHDKILMAWWAEHGFNPGEAVYIEDHRDPMQTKWIIRRSTPEERLLATLTAGKENSLLEPLWKTLNHNNNGIVPEKTDWVPVTKKRLTTALKKIAQKERADLC